MIDAQISFSNEKTLLAGSKVRSRELLYTTRDVASAMRKLSLLFWIVPVVLVLDQVVKALIRALPVGTSKTVILGFFWLTHAQNTGASFSILTGNNLLLVFVALIVLGGLLWWHDTFQTMTEKACYFLIMGGLLGNLIDRVLFGSVTDLFDLGWFPVFNVADSALVVGVIGLIVYELFGKRREAKKQGAKGRADHP